MKADSIMSQSLLRPPIILLGAQRPILQAEHRILSTTAVSQETYRRLAAEVAKKNIWQRTQ